MLRYGEAAGGRVLRMEPRARGVDYGPVVPAAASPAMDREMRLAHNKKCVARYWQSIAAWRDGCVCVAPAAAPPRSICRPEHLGSRLTAGFGHGAALIEAVSPDTRCRRQSTGCHRAASHVCVLFSIDIHAQSHPSCGAVFRRMF